MARYIDLEEFEKRINEHIKPETLEEKPLIEWCKDECIRQGYAMPAAYVAPKSKVEALEKEIERLKKILNNYALQYGTVMSQQKVIDKAKSEVAREIFEEIEKHILENCCVTDDDVDGIWKHIAELKKKYTEEKE